MTKLYDIRPQSLVIGHDVFSDSLRHGVTLLHTLGTEATLVTPSFTQRHNIVAKAIPEGLLPQKLEKGNTNQKF